MKDEFTIRTVNGIVVVEFCAGSVFSPETIMRAAQLERADDAFVGLDDIWDIRGCTVSDDLNFRTMNEIIGFLQSDEVHLKNQRTAILVSNNVQYGTSRMFQTLADKLPSTISIFEGMEEAMNWLKS